MPELAHRRPGPKMFEGQKPPDVHMMSIDNLDWYKEQIERCEKGFTFRGDRFTGDMWWYYNMCPMAAFELDKNGKPTPNVITTYPYWCQTDDYLFKQIEEAEQDGKDTFIMTNRGYGKTYLVLSIGGKIFYLKGRKEGSAMIESVICASGEDHADPTWLKFQLLIQGVNKVHPSIAINLLQSGSNGTILSGNRIQNAQGGWDSVITGKMEKKVYDKKPGKTKGRRLDFQHFEEIGDWGGAATLKECIAASEGTWYIGETKKARVFYTGTGGTVLSDEAKDICFNPDAYNLYKVKDWSERGTAIVIPAYKKFGGTWEDTGFPDEVRAKEIMTKRREEKKTDPDPTAYNKYIQENPWTISEMFQKSGGNRFDLNKIGNNITEHELFPEKRKGEWGDLQWRFKDGIKTGEVEWIQNNKGKIWILEHPVINPDTKKAWEKLYVAGYDGIDLGTQDTKTGKGSDGSISVKKRLLPGSGIANAYICHYFDRPTDVDILYDNCLKIAVYFNLQKALNIEDTKRGIVGFFKKEKAYHYFMPRPKLTLSNAVTENESNLIGTTAVAKNFEYAENFLVTYIKDCGELIYCLPVNEDLRDFTMENRGKHDKTVSMFMCELADDEFRFVPVQKPKPVPIDIQVGYYTDSDGIKRWGEIPKTFKRNKDQFGFRTDEGNIR